MLLDDLTKAPSTDPSSIYRYRDGLAAVDLLTAAITHFDFFTWLGTHPSSLAEICTHFGFAPRPTDVMLTLFTANRFIERQGERFVLTELGREHLTATSPWSLASYFAPIKDRPMVEGFVRVLRTGQPGGVSTVVSSDWHAAMETDTFARTFTAAMDARGRHLAQALAASVDLSGRTRVLDIGGGSGVYACAFAARHPSVTATVVEQPPVDGLAREQIAARGFASRVAVHTADFRVDPWPRGSDVHLFSNVLHDWGVDVINQLLATSFASLEANGLLVVHEAFINRDKTGPLPVAAYSALLMYITQGQCYAISEYERLFEAAGFVDVTYAETVNDRGVMTARKPSSNA